MTPVMTEVQDLLGKGFSQAAIGRFYGVSQSTVNNWLGKSKMARRITSVYVNRFRRDGVVEKAHAREVWEPYRIAHPTVAKLFFETRASELRLIPPTGIRLY